MATPDEILSAEAYKISIASTVHPPMAAPPWMETFIADHFLPLQHSVQRILDRFDRMVDHTTAIKQMTTRAYNAGCGNGDHIPYLH
ncbi:hypothetical protein BS47DRAFT_1345082 [Hydnum rufescens UP504]|uniref:Uncharacterized protein n=1 Tax=Hydnum rufescens UP504 TaxID=1448309 RepID=A0A9P6AWT1_9AGAM|nr:hypothetical protein BS47DRAFT_1345082 [Hydnum rufescens UP504]